MGILEISGSLDLSGNLTPVTFGLAAIAHIEPHYLRLVAAQLEDFGD